MRVISGSARGKKLVTLEGLATRPTLDRVKEAVFNILQFDLKDKNILDLFSGSGALAIEALSRGAKRAVLCDFSSKAVDIINKNLEATRLKERAEVINKDYIEALKILNNKDEKFDIIFLDPPYKTDFIIRSIELIITYNLLQENGIIVAETDDKNRVEQIKGINNIEIYNIRKYGKKEIIFIRKG